MATYKGTGFDTTSARIRTGTNSDVIEFDSQIKGDDGLNITANGADIVGNTSVTGNLTVTGTLISQDEEQVMVKDNFIDLNFGYVGTSYEQAGLTINWKGDAAGVSINTTTNNINFTAGTTGARAKVVADTTSGIPADTFAAGDIIQISGTTNADNDGVYVVHSNGSAGTVEIKSSTLSTPDAIDAKFALSNFTTEEEATANPVTLRKVNLLALRASNAGQLQQAIGSTDGQFQDSDYLAVGSDTPLQASYDAGNTITTDASGAISFTLSADNQGLDVQGASAGLGVVSIGGGTAVDSFVVGASGAASSITSTGQNLTLQTATSGTVTLRSAAALTMDSDDTMTIQMDANDGGDKDIAIVANNAGGGSAEVNIDADDGVNLAINGGAKIAITNANSTFNNTIQADTTAGLKFGGSGIQMVGVLDEDNMATDSNTNFATQQSIKAYVDTRGVTAYEALPNLTADATGLAIRDVVAIIASGLDAGKATKGNAATIANGQVLGFAPAAIAGGAVGKVAQSGVLGGFSGLTAGARYYLSATSAGAIVATPPTGANNVIVQVGYALSASTLAIAPMFIAEID